jgi:hypothetical protein
LGTEAQLQVRLRALVSYSYGTEGGVDGDTPNPWGLRLWLLRGVLALGMLVAGISGGGYGAGWFLPLISLLGMASGSALVLAAGLGMLRWMQWRSTPKDVLERRASDTLLSVGFTLRTNHSQTPYPVGRRALTPGSSGMAGVRALHANAGHRAGRAGLAARNG